MTRKYAPTREGKQCHKGFFQAGGVHLPKSISRLRDFDACQVRKEHGRLSPSHVGVEEKRWLTHQLACTQLSGERAEAPAIRCSWSDLEDLSENVPYGAVHICLLYLRTHAWRGVRARPIVPRWSRSPESLANRVGAVGSEAAWVNEKYQLPPGPVMAKKLVVWWPVVYERKKERKKEEASGFWAGMVKVLL
ncbi:hypothetical protein B0H10DRAFT_1960657 [Mycena sp. CBHHK59/15]|nr:hypothetical protein B0H10DRAFT_1960657 [Mycena sp. CBHHK59/15]